jgi:hypothetical protein
MCSIRTFLLHKGTLYGVDKHLSDTRRHVILGPYGPVCYKKEYYMGSIMTCLIQDVTLYGVKEGLSDKRRHILRVQ